MPGRVLRGTLIVTGVLMLGISWWVARSFGPITLIQLWLNLPKVGRGLNPTEQGYVWHLVLNAVVLPLALLLAVMVALRVIRRYRPTRRDRPRRWPAVVTPLVGAIVLATTIGLPGHIRWLMSDLTMSPYYAAPAPGENSEPRNLVTIYLESIETAFADESRFGTNLLEPLEEATADWASIEGLTSYESGGWTMAGIVGVECGVPLRGPGLGKADLSPTAIGWEQDGYLPGATCLGDVLSSEGYTSVFMGGADANFANKGSYLLGHGYDEVLDLHTWNDLGETEFSTWGLSDERLMERAKDEVTRLHDAAEPFQLTALTLDSHDPAHLHPSCPATSDVEMSSAISCSMQAVADFVDFLDARGYLEDTVVVLVGDHAKMVGVGSAYYEELGNVDPDERPLFNRIWSPDGVTIARQGVDQLSLYPTILDLLGYGSEDHRAGVAVSALVSTTGPGSMLELSPQEYSDTVQSRSPDLYEMLWTVPSEPSVAAASPP